MYIIQIASECAPAIKAGGLGDVVSGLSRELESRGHTVELILPKYDCMRYDLIEDLQEAFRDLWVPWYGGSIHCHIYIGKIDGRVAFFIEPHSQDHFFNRGQFYGATDDPMRFAFFCRAAMEFLLRSNKRPDIIHCHDWQTGLIPVLLYEHYQWHGMGHQRVCYTIHNFKHQGQAGVDVLWATGLNNEPHYFHPDRLQDNFNPFAINFMKGGIVYSNAVNTVSPHHAWEARYTDINYGLGHTLAVHQDKFTGILNGIDYETWNPETDPYIPTPYTINTISGKLQNQKALRERLLLRHENKPIVAFVGRLDQQKGVHLVLHALYYALGQGAQFVLLGLATSADISSRFWHEKHHLNNNPDCHLELSFNQELAHLIYAGADMIVVPSNYEPCGLTQLIGLRYGTVPIVRAVGGLVNTVFDRDFAPETLSEKRNGYVFEHSNHQALESAMNRAISLWKERPIDFRQLIIQGMQCDYSWKHPTDDYLKLYERIRHK